MLGPTGCATVTIFNPSVSPLKRAPMGQLRVLQAEAPVGGSCGARGKKEGEIGGREKAAPAPDVNQGEGCAWARDRLPDRRWRLQPGCTGLCSAATEPRARPAAGETLLSSRFQGQGCSSASNPEPGHPPTPTGATAAQIHLAVCSRSPGTRCPGSSSGAARGWGRLWQDFWILAWNAVPWENQREIPTRLPGSRFHSPSSEGLEMATAREVVADSPYSFGACLSAQFSPSYTSAFNYQSSLKSVSPGRPPHMRAPTHTPSDTGDQWAPSARTGVHQERCRCRPGSPNRARGEPGPSSPPAAAFAERPALWA